MVQEESLGEAKILGGIGSILFLFSIKLPFLFLVSLILILIAISKIASAAKEKEIFQNYLIGIVFNCVAIGGALVFLFGNLMINIFSFFMYRKIGEWNSQMILGLAILWVFYIIGHFFQRKSFVQIAKKTDSFLFEIAGNLHVLGALFLILGIGLILEILATIVTIVAFFSLPESLPKA